MRIRELSMKTGLTIDTIRFYEKRGLLGQAHMRRGANRYREYNDKAVERLQLIRQAQLLGLTLSEIGQSIQAWEDQMFTKEEVRGFFTEKIAEVDARIQELYQIRAYLCEKLENLD
ncbi:MAG: Cd(II)/Pb(II)-responsive transcriptional regulator [Anaerolineae bacterium]